MPAFTSHRPLCRASLAAALVLAITQTATADQLEYRGTLYASGSPAEGVHTLRFTPYSAEEGGVALALPQVLHGVGIAKGQITADLEFGAAISQHEIVWLKVEIADASSADFYAMPDRQVASTKLGGACWSTSGNAGTDGSIDFIGTSDNQPLILRAGNEALAKFIAGPTGFDLGNIAFGVAQFVAADAEGAIVGGGTSNSVGGSHSTVAGGTANSAGSPAVLNDSSNHVTVSGGFANLADGDASTIVGGQSNRSTGDYSVSGGYNNNAIGNRSVSFGSSNTSDGSTSFAVGSQNCAGGVSSAALGSRARVRSSSMSSTGCGATQQSGDMNGDEGTFMWADTLGNDFVSSGPNQFLIRAAGGVLVNTNLAIPETELVVRGSNGGRGDLLVASGQSPIQGVSYVGHKFSTFGTSSGSAELEITREVGALVSTSTDLASFDSTGRFRIFTDSPIKPTAGAWSAPSDERLKTDIYALGRGALDKLLQLEGVTFKYKADAPSQYFVPGVHTGFVAQDVEKVFPEWVTTDADGYRLVGPQGFEALVVEALRELRREGEEKIARRDMELRELRAMVDQLSAANAVLAARLDEVEPKRVAMASTVAASNESAGMR